MSSEYDDIITLPRHQSARRRHMSQSDRAAQFAPFAALTGYEDSIAEKGRQTTARPVPGEDQKIMLDRKLQYLADLQSGHPWVIIAYFHPDIQKNGGCYEQISGTLKKLDPVQQTLILEEDITLHLENIMDILLIKQL